MVQVLSDLVQLPSSMYFHGRAPGSSAAVVFLTRRRMLAEARSGDAALAEASSLLQSMLDSVAETLSSQGLVDGRGEWALGAYADVHGHNREVP